MRCTTAVSSYRNVCTPIAVVAGTFMTNDSISVLVETWEAVLSCTLFSCCHLLGSASCTLGDRRAIPAVQSELLLRAAALLEEKSLRNYFVCAVWWGQLSSGQRPLVALIGFQEEFCSMSPPGVLSLVWDPGFCCFVSFWCALGERVMISFSKRDFFWLTENGK